MQRRSAERVQRMLDAAQQLVADIGYEALSTTLIAERAEVSIGSLYQFFPDKQAVVRAVALRNLERFEERVGSLISTLEFRDWWDVVSAVLDEYIALHHEIPGFSVIRFGDIADIYLLEAGRDNDAVVAERLSELLRGLELVGPDVPSEFPMTIAIKLSDTLVRYAFARAPKGDPQVLEEVKHVVHDYLTRHLGQPGRR
jgi:AcrR family transcriptional regulator